MAWLGLSHATAGLGLGFAPGAGRRLALELDLAALFTLTPIRYEVRNVAGDPIARRGPRVGAMLTFTVRFGGLEPGGSGVGNKG